MTEFDPAAQAAFVLSEALQRIAGQAGRPDSFSARLIDWQHVHGRHGLPWQQQRNAYRVWLSEIMLQQTQVSTVLPYYQRFLERFPDVASLAAAPAEELMSYWSGLGYYTRARNLHKCAQRVVAEYQGQFPDDPARLQDLPGIGRSMAAAIAGFAFGRRAAILDGNVKRVFCRVFGISGYPGSKPVEDQLWQLAEALLPEQDIASYTQGLMDLGATVCTRSRPACQRCPMQSRCVAQARGLTAELPERKPKARQRHKQGVFLVLLHQGRILLERRPDSGIWGGLLSLPELDGMQDFEPGQAAGPAAWQLQQLAQHPRIQMLQQQLGGFGEWRPLAPIEHVFTHFRLHMLPLMSELAVLQEGVTMPGWQWLPIEQAIQAGLPAPVKSLLEWLISEPATLF